MKILCLFLGENDSDKRRAYIYINLEIVDQLDFEVCFDPQIIHSWSFQEIHLFDS